MNKKNKTPATSADQGHGNRTRLCDKPVPSTHFVRSSSGGAFAVRVSSEKGSTT